MEKNFSEGPFGTLLLIIKLILVVAKVLLYPSMNSAIFTTVNSVLQKFDNNC